MSEALLRITSVEVQKNNPHRFNIFLDGQFAFGADEDTVVNFRLIPGKVIEEASLQKILFEVEVGKLMERMYSLFNIRRRSEKEIRDYLKNLSFKRKMKETEQISSIVVESLIEKLKQKKMLDDEQFAKSWVEARRRSKNKGVIAIKSELFQKGIDKEIVAQVLNTLTQEEGEEDLAIKAIEKKMRGWKGLSKMEFKKKAYGFLQRKGFTSDTVITVIEKMIEKG